MKEKEFEKCLTELMVGTDSRVIEYFKAHKEIIKEIDGLTEWKLFEDLKDAIKIQHGYFKNDIGEYLYVKGIEVTNDTSNLCRMGYNGEDRGVWVHYCEIADRRAIYNDVPVTMFTYFMSNAVEEKKRLKPTTKEDFEQQVQKTIQSFISDYQEKRDINEYYDFMTGWDDICNKVRKEYTENKEMREEGKRRLTEKPIEIPNDVIDEV